MSTDKNFAAAPAGGSLHAAADALAVVMKIGVLQGQDHGKLAAFMQADDLDEVKLELYGRHTADMRRRLVKLMGLRPDQILRFRKPPFGDVRSPKLWHNTADEVQCECGFVAHRLEPCVQISTYYRVLHQKSTLLPR